MKLITPKADLMKLELLQNIEHELRTPTSIVPPLPTALVDSVSENLSRYRQHYHRLLQARQEWQRSSSACKVYERKLQQMIRDAYQQVKRKARDGGLAKSQLEALGLTTKATQTPQIRKMQAPIQLAHVLVVAAQEAQSQGVLVLTDPSPEAIQTAANNLIAAKDQLAVKREAERSAFEAMQQQRSEVHALLLRIKLSVRMASIGQSAAAQRGLFRALGFSYSSEAAQPEATDTTSMNEKTSLPKKPTEAVADMENVHQQVAHAGTHNNLDINEAAGERAKVPPEGLQPTHCECSPRPMASPLIKNGEQTMMKHCSLSTVQPSKTMDNLPIQHRQRVQTFIRPKYCFKRLPKRAPRKWHHRLHSRATKQGEQTRLLDNSHIPG